MTDDQPIALEETSNSGLILFAGLAGVLLVLLAVPKLLLYAAVIAVTGGLAAYVLNRPGKDVSSSTVQLQELPRKPSSSKAVSSPKATAQSQQMNGIAHPAEPAQTPEQQPDAAGTRKTGDDSDAPSQRQSQAAQPGAPDAPSPVDGPDKSSVATQSAASSGQQQTSEDQSRSEDSTTTAMPPLLSAEAQSSGADSAESAPQPSPQPVQQQPAAAAAKAAQPAAGAAGGAAILARLKCAAYSLLLHSLIWPVICQTHSLQKVR